MKLMAIIRSLKEYILRNISFDKMQGHKAIVWSLNIKNYK